MGKTVKFFWKGTSQDRKGLPEFEKESKNKNIDKRMLQIRGLEREKEFNGEGGNGESKLGEKMTKIHYTPV